ncbi:hypothetical protein K2X33_11865 [bacterium]|nr:hypothetical protein [bacterium]
MRWIAAALTFSFAASAAWVPNQLHPRRFAACLKAAAPGASLKSVRPYEKQHKLTDNDLLLMHLAFYPGVEIPGLGWVMHSKARLWWSGWWEKQEHALALGFQAHANQRRTLFPSGFFAAAVKTCGQGNYFCAALISHNVLRTLGRHPHGIHTAILSGQKTDNNPKWFQKDRAKWLAGLDSQKESLIPLRLDGGGDRWGEWYHFFGIFTYALHEAALGRSPSSIDFVVRMNEILNPLLAGGQEEPEKAQLDRDAVEVAQWFLTDAQPPKVDCADAQTYTAGTWSDAPEAFPLVD